MFGNRIDIFYRDTSDGRSFFDFILYIARNGTITTATGNQFRITYQVGFDQYILEFTGSGFIYGPNGPIAGTLFDLNIINFARPIYNSYGYDSSLAAMWTAIKDSLFFGTEAPLASHFDTFEHYTTGTGLGDEIYGGALSDVISGINGNDVIYGLDGNDVIGGGNGEDTIYGGFGNDNINGDAGNDVIFGDAGGDILRGNAGTDELRGGLGNDSLEGGDDNDVLYGDAGTDSLNGGNGDDTLYGGDDADTLRGGADADILFGQNGNDRLFGDAGNDDLYGGAGADAFDGGTELDVVRYDNATTGIYVRLDGVVGASGEAVGDTFASIEGLVGSAFGDVLVGSSNAVGDFLNGAAGNDSIYGLNGADSLLGGTGNDSLYGGAGADVLDGGTEFDLARYDNASTSIYTRLDGVAGQYGEAVGDTYISIEGLVGSASNDTFVGSNVSNDSLFGLAGNDGLYSLGGSDYLDGGLGNDTLAGGAGADRFVFSSALGTTNVDTITDFSAGNDDIVLSQAIFVGIGASLDASEFQIGEADSVTDRIIYNQATGQLFYDLDGNGAGGQTLFVTVTAGTVLTLADFVMVA